ESRDPYSVSRWYVPYGGRNLEYIVRHPFGICESARNAQTHAHRRGTAEITTRIYGQNKQLLCRRVGLAVSRSRAFSFSIRGFRTRLDAETSANRNMPSGTVGCQH